MLYTKKLDSNLLASIGIMILGICYFVFVDYDAKVFSYDEIFSIALVQYSYSDIWQITATDVHPPLYYLILKAFVSIFGEKLVVYRLFSALGVVASLILGVFFVRKYWGDRVSLLFIIILIILPTTQYLATEVRMYSWAMFFVLMAIVSAYRVLLGPSIMSYGGLLVASICSAYTHYFALLGILCILFILLCYFIYLGKKVLPLFICIFLFIGALCF